MRTLSRCIVDGLNPNASGGDGQIYAVTVSSLCAAESFISAINRMCTNLAGSQPKEDEFPCLWKDDATKMQTVLAEQRGRAENHICNRLGVMTPNAVTAEDRSSLSSPSNGEVLWNRYGGLGNEKQVRGTVTQGCSDSWAGATEQIAQGVQQLVKCLPSTVQSPVDKY